ncbi:hypothetical protein [Rhodanobacter sp. Soil772]|jgi:hypothetical protein|uniref:hypothetical protein n=1 Tax=Rhodanobacter sp. Soil772 TaxID=1736406 RepID=UPI001F43689C|nr:hypothetical protein [Rhodanobacter sp. Soil772]
MVIELPDAIGEVDGVVFASGTFMVLHAAWAAFGTRANRAIISNQARGRQMNDERRATARCIDER